MSGNIARSELLHGYTCNITSCIHLLPVMKVGRSDIPSGLCLVDAGSMDCPNRQADANVKETIVAFHILNSSSLIPLFY